MDTSSNAVPGIKVIFDLRSENEIKRDGPEWASVEADNPDPFAAHGTVSYTHLTLPTKRIV